MPELRLKGAYNLTVMNQLKETSKRIYGIEFKELNAYTLCCGYIQEAHIGETRVQLSHESSHYHVMTRNYTDRMNFLSLTEARKEFKNRVKELAK